MASGDAAAQLQEQYQGYATGLAMKLFKSLNVKVDPDDVKGYAFMGLAEAAAQYDPRAGASFETFAYYRIRGAVFDGLRKMTWLPPAARRGAAAAEGADAVLEGRVHGASGAEDPEALAREFNEAIQLLGAVYTVSQLGGRAEDSDRPLDTADEGAEEVGAGIEQREVIDRVHEAITQLPEKQRRIVQLIYVQQQSMTEIAREMGVNKSTVSREHTRAMAALREMLVALVT